MHKNIIEQYIRDVLEIANLAKKDKARIHHELWDHIHSWWEENVFDNIQQDEKEIRNMVEQEFGKAESVGQAISTAKGKWLTYWKKQRFRIPAAVFIALVLSFAIKGFAVESFWVANDSLEPIVKEGEYLLINKISSSFEQGDIIIYKLPETDSKHLTGIVEQVDPKEMLIKVKRNDQEPIWIKQKDVSGKVMIQVR